MTGTSTEINSTIPVIFVFSAPNASHLKEYASQFLADVQKEIRPFRQKHEIEYSDLKNIAYTLQLNRHHHPVRLSLAVRDKSELIEGLSDFINSYPNTSDYPFVHSNFLEPEKSFRFAEIVDKETVGTLLELHDHNTVAYLWSAGLDITEWEDLYPEKRPDTVLLPAYSFDEMPHSFETHDPAAAFDSPAANVFTDINPGISADIPSSKDDLANNFPAALNEPSSSPGNDGAIAIQKGAYSHSREQSIFRITADESNVHRGPFAGLREPVTPVHDVHDVKIPDTILPAAPQGILLKKVLRVISSTLKIDEEDIDIERALKDYGLDSIAGMHLFNAFENAFKVKLDQERLYEISTVKDLAHYIQTASSTPATSPGEGISVFSSSKTISQTTGIYSGTGWQRNQIDPSLKSDYILLTGGTGVIGGKLLADLLETTHKKIYCLIKDHDIDRAIKRIKLMVEVYSPGRFSLQEVETRVAPVLGDITKPFLGLSEDTCRQIAANVDLVVHAAGSTSLRGIYKEVEGVNVIGTEHMIDFAMMTSQKYLAYISSYTVMGSLLFETAAPFTEHELDRGQHFKHLGYQRSKFEAETRVMAASERGLKWIIFRPGNVMGDSQNGRYPLRETNTTGIFYETFKAVIESQIAVANNQYYDITPVDYISRSIVYLCAVRKSIYETYHLTNPDIKTFQELIDILTACGFSIDMISIEELERLLGMMTRTLPVLFELMKFNPAMRPSKESNYADSQYTKRILAQADIVCPPIDKDLIMTYMDYCIRFGYLQRPQLSKRVNNKVKLWAFRASEAYRAALKAVRPQTR